MFKIIKLLIILAIIAGVLFGISYVAHGVISSGNGDLMDNIDTTSFSDSSSGNILDEIRDTIRSHIAGMTN